MFEHAFFEFHATIHATEIKKPLYMWLFWLSGTHPPKDSPVLVSTPSCLMDFCYNIAVIIA